MAGSGNGPASSSPFIGLTGAVAAGKSAALSLLEDLGCATLSADDVVHEVLASDEVVELVRRRLGEGAVVGDAVDRDAVARVVFADDESRQWLESTVWPRVAQRIWEWRTKQQELSPISRALVVEVPLLFEAGMEAAFDATVAITARSAVRDARAAERGHESVGQREARQVSQEEKAKRADHAVRNDGSLEQLRAKLSELLDEIAPER